ncbi:dihydrofolate reductase family protein [Nocardiopsis coralliicola]
MRELTYFVAVTLDGRVCAPDGDFSAFPNGAGDDEGTAFHFEEYPELVPAAIRTHLGLDLGPNRHFDTLVQGRGSYEVALDEGVTRPYAHMREVVLSSTLGPDTEPEVEFVASDPLQRIRELKAEDSPLGICLVGGPKAAAELLPEIDNFLVKRYPVIFGAGLPLFDGSPYAPAAVERVWTRTLDTGADYSLYRRA